MSTNRIDGDYGEVVVPFGKHKGGTGGRSARFLHKDVMCGTCHLIHHRKEQREKYEKWPL